MLLSAVLGAVCLARPLGQFADGSVLYNLRLATAEGNSYSPWALFALLLIATVLSALGILLYRQRALQMRLCSLTIILLVGHLIYLAFVAYIASADAVFTPTVSAAFPIVMIILLAMAFRGILRDEMLIRSTERLR